MLYISHNIVIPYRELEISATRSQGAGGQNVNKVATAVHLRFDILSSSLPENTKQRLMNISDSRITEGGVVVIKAQSHRTQEQNKKEAIHRLRQLILSATVVPKVRRPTKPSKASKVRRLDSKTRRGKLKSTRGPVRTD